MTATIDLLLDADHEQVPPYSPVCTFCTHLLRDGEGMVCEAYPKGIPRAIWLGANIHRQPVPGDHGIEFALKAGTPPEVVERNMHPLSEGLGLVGEGYNPDQPRVPAGSPGGGEFAGGEGGREGGGSKDEAAPAFESGRAGEQWLHERFPGTKFDFEGVEAGPLLTRVADQYVALAREWPEVAGGLKFFGTGLGRGDGVEVETGVRRMPTVVAGDYFELQWESYHGVMAETIGHEAIGLNPRYYGSVQKFTAGAKEAGSGWLADPTPEGSVRHEFGHALQSFYNRDQMSDNNPARDTIQMFTRAHETDPQILARLPTAPRVARADLPSQYAATNGHEAFAEGFSQLRLPETQWAPYTRELSTVLRDVRKASGLSEAGGWAEELHPRDDHGRFSAGGGGKAAGGDAGRDVVPTFASAGDAERWLHERYPKTTFDLEGVDQPLIQGLANGYARVAADWTQVADSINYVGIGGKVEGAMPPTLLPAMGLPKGTQWATVLEGQNRAGVFAWTMRFNDGASGAMIVLNPKYFGDAGKMQQAYALAEKEYVAKRGEGKLPFGVGATSPEGVIIHEFGHNVDSYTDRKQQLDKYPIMMMRQQSGPQDASREVFNQRVAALRPEDAPSKYGQTNASEAFAEGFAAIYTQPRGEWAPYTATEHTFLTAYSTTKNRYHEIFAPGNKDRGTHFGLTEAYSEDQPRDEKGRWSATGGAGSKGAAKERAGVERAPTFGSTKEAEAWLSQRWPQTRFDLDATDTSILSDVATRFNEVAKAYPGPMATLDYVGTFNGPAAGEFFGEYNAEKFRKEWAAGGEHVNTYAYVSGDGHVMGLNPRFFGAGNLMETHYLATDIRDGWHPPGTGTAGGIVTHEYGHLVDQYLGRQSLMTFLPQVSASGMGLVNETMGWFTSEWYDRLQSTKVAGAPKSYADTNQREAFAEAFAQAHTSLSNRQVQPYTRATREILKTLFVDHPPETWVHHASVSDVPFADPRRGVPVDQKVRAEAKEIARRLKIKEADTNVPASGYSDGWEIIYVGEVFDPDEPRDEHGRWASGGGGGGPSAKTERDMMARRLEGGFTYLTGARRFKEIGERGYSVAYHPTAKTSWVFDYNKSGESMQNTRVFNRSISRSDIHTFMTNNAAILKQPGNAVGLWHDTDSGRYYLDISHVMMNRSGALAAGRAQDQISIFDFRNGTTIDTGGTGGAGAAAREAAREFAGAGDVGRGDRRGAGEDGWAPRDAGRDRRGPGSGGAVRGPRELVEANATDATVLRDAYERTLKGEWEADNPDATESTLVATGDRGSLYRVEDGWGSWYFLVDGAKARYVAMVHADVPAYHVEDPWGDDFPKSRVAEMGWGDVAWDQALASAVLGDAAEVGEAFNIDQPRDERGRWSSTGGGGGGAKDDTGDKSASGATAGGLRGGRGELSGGSGGVAASGGPAAGAGGGAAQPLPGAPRAATIAGLGKIEITPSERIRAVAENYCREHGIKYDPPKEYVKVDPARSTRIAQAYEEMKHDPQNPRVARAYNQMIKETTAQYEAVMKAGLKVEFIDYAKQGDPYAASPRLAILDIQKNNHMWVFSTRDGFGSNDKFDPHDNPLLRSTSYTISGQPALANDLFRVVHDYFGHAQEGNGMRAQPMDAKLLTPTGWKLMGEVRVGDRLVSPSGGVTHVTRIQRRGLQRVYRITFNDGSTTRCGIDHRWQVRWAKDERWQTKTTEQLIAAQQKSLRGSWKLEIPLAEHIDFEARALPIDPYVLGTILGDGHINSSVSIGVDDYAIIERVEERLPAGVAIKRQAGRDTYALTTGLGSTHNPISTGLKSLGLGGARGPDKFVPAEYKFSSYGNRLRVLQGLMDTDGGASCDTRSEAQWSYARFRSTSERLAWDVRFLAQSLGGTATVNWAPAREYMHKAEIHHKRPIWTVTVRLPLDLSPFALGRKRAAVLSKNAPARHLRSIEEDGFEEMQCIEVDSASHLYVTDDFIVTRNSDGEENAWREHSAMFTPLARQAMTSETRGQNSWVNYGPYGEQNRTASGADTHYADQKVGIMPRWTATEGARGPSGPTKAHEAWDGLDGDRDGVEEIAPAVMRDRAEVKAVGPAGERDGTGAGFAQDAQNSFPITATFGEIKPLEPLPYPWDDDEPVGERDIEEGVAPAAERDGYGTLAGRPLIEVLFDAEGRSIFDEVFNDSQPRDDHGRWAGGGGAATQKGPEINEAFVEKVREDPLRKERMGLLAAAKNMTPAAYEQALNEHLQQLADKSGVYVRVSGGLLEKIIEDGRLKSQFEVHASSGNLDEDGRAETEEVLYKFDGRPVGERPIYGYVADSDNHGLSAKPPTDVLRGIHGLTPAEAQYGRVVLELKPAVHDRTTVTGNDSLYLGTKYGQEAYMAPQPLRGLTHLAFDLPNMGPGWQDHYVSRPLNPLDWKTLEVGPRLPASIYTEAQIHGGVKVSDIAHVYWDANGLDERGAATYERVAAAAKSAGLDVTKLDARR